MSLDDAIRDELADDAEGFPVVSYVLYAVRMNPADESLVTSLLVPAGQHFYSTLGLLRSATLEAESDATPVFWIVGDDDDDD